MALAPYYQDDHCTIYHGDCLDVLARLKTDGVRVDQVLTSPPYNLGGVRGGCTEWRRLRAGYGEHDDEMPHTEYVRWQRDTVAALWRILTDNGAIYYQHKPRAIGNEAILPFDLIPDGIPLRQIITWDRTGGFQRNLTHYVPSYEWILVLAKPAFRINTQSVPDLWRIPPVADPDHPASFPLALASKALATTDSAIVLDPFMGSGTTLRAAKDLGRRAIGIEREERYCEIAARRLAQEVLF